MAPGFDRNGAGTAGITLGFEREGTVLAGITPGSAQYGAVPGGMPLGIDWDGTVPWQITIHSARNGAARMETMPLRGWSGVAHGKPEAQS